MIVLGKDKVDERFNILADGTIVDLNGNVQKLRIHHERLVFKGLLVHQIQMYTNYGWRDTKIWDIHHKDENKLNNSLSNLIFLTKSEHSKLHMEGKGNSMYGKHWKLSNETKQKISESMKGKNHHFYGKHHSEETIKRISNALKGKHHSEERNEKNRIAHYGKHHNEETKQKISESMKKYFKSKKSNKKNK